MGLAKAQLKEKKKCEKNGFYCGNVVSDHPMPLPEVGKIYIAYDDGKIRPTREYKVKVLGILTYKQLPKEMKKLWKQEVIKSYWLFSPKSDYFIKTIVVGIDDGEEQYFARTHGSTWFCINGLDWNYCGELDVDGSLYAQAHQNN